MFLIRTQQFRKFDKELIKQIRNDCYLSAQILRKELCGKDKCLTFKFYRMEVLRTIVVGNSSLRTLVQGFLGNPRNELALPSNVKWIFYRNAQFLQCQKWREYEKTVLSIILLANSMRKLSKVMYTDIQSMLAKNVTDPKQNDFIKEFILSELFDHFLTFFVFVLFS